MGKWVSRIPVNTPYSDLVPQQEQIMEITNL